MKKVKIISPYQKKMLPFQKPIYEIAVEMGYKHRGRIYIPGFLRYFIFKYKPSRYYSFLPLGEFAQIHLISGTHPDIMLFPYTYRNEIIPVIWDCWPSCRERIADILKKCNIKIVFFTSKENAVFFSTIFPQKNFYYIPEAININNYVQGPNLCKRKIDILEYGRSNGEIHEKLLKIKSVNHLYPKDGKHLFATFSNLANALADTKIVICYPRSMTESKVAQGIETLTQRYWECMYSGCLIVGHAPKELIDFIGYNPVIECTIDNIENSVTSVLSNIEDYQYLSYKNMKIAAEYGCWTNRFKYMSNVLESQGYKFE